MNRLMRFIRKYEFPFHSLLFGRTIAKALSVAVSTGWLRLFLKITGCSFGRNLKADGFPVIRISKRSTLMFGDGCLLKSRFCSNLIGKTNPVILECIGNGRIIFGNRSGCSFAVLSSRSGITIGDNAMIGGNVRIFDHDYHSLNYLLY